MTHPWPHPASGPGPVPDGGPVHHRWRKIVGRTLSKAWADSLFGMSSQAAFWCAMSTAPFLLALLGLSGFFTRWLFGRHASTTIREQVLHVPQHDLQRGGRERPVGNTIDTILDNGQPT